MLGRVYLVCRLSKQCSSYLNLQSTHSSHQSYVRENKAILSLRLNADVIMRLTYNKAVK